MLYLAFRLIHVSGDPIVYFYCRLFNASTVTTVNFSKGPVFFFLTLLFDPTLIFYFVVIFSNLEKAFRDAKSLFSDSNDLIVAYHKNKINIRLSDVTIKLACLRK